MKAPDRFEGSITLNYNIPYELILGDVSADGKSVECVVRFPGFNPVDTKYEVVE